MEKLQPQNRVVFPALDGLRAVAFLMVLGQHYVFLPWGWAGVNVFFVLSGFLITGILLDTQNDPHRARNFYVRRTLRIFPLYYGLILVLLLLDPWMHWQWGRRWVAWVLYLGNFLRFKAREFSMAGAEEEWAADGHLRSAHLSFRQLNLGHLWSLCVEEQFYLVWPWIAFSIRSRRALLWVCGSTVVLVPLARWFAQAHAPRWMLEAELLYRVTPFQVDSLLLGGLVAILWRGQYRRQMLQAAPWVTGTMLGIAVLYTGIELKSAWHQTPYFLGEFPFRYYSWRLTWGLTYINVLSAGLIVCALRPGTLTYRIFDVKLLRWLGRISYGLYVFHDIFHVAYLNMAKWISFRLVPPSYVSWILSPIAAVLALVTTIAMAWLSYRFFEAPILSLKERWTTRSERARAAQTGEVFQQISKVV